MDECFAHLIVFKKCHITQSICIPRRSISPKIVSLHFVAHDFSEAARAYKAEYWAQTIAIRETLSNESSKTSRPLYVVTLTYLLIKSNPHNVVWHQVGYFVYSDVRGSC